MKKLTLVALLLLSVSGFAANSDGAEKEQSLGMDLVSVHEGVNCDGTMDYNGSESSIKGLVQGPASINE